ncbi:phosphotransferase [Planobispora siamensis]|uniref:Choline kinase n=1 Tax=Planobispora siamensis TaxID=936338 RepID=A0A8J3SE07_9ACTN|nr:phosphotransferase [Planobispora siamensis]GIH91122.1 choline kinase [Planobispora siamensis]
MPDALAAVREWAGQPVTETPIKGGLSHRIARVDAADGRRWLLRVLDPRVSAAGLGIPLDQEIANTLRAAEAGIGPRVLHRMPGALLLEYLEGTTLDAHAVRAMPGPVAAACRRLHAGPRFVNDFSIFRKLEEFLALCGAHGLGTPAGFEDRLPAVAEIERALGADPLPSAPCHNDLLPENFIHCGDGVRIVDYQLSGNNDPAFELGDIAAEADYHPDLTCQLARAYFGEDSPRLTARVRLNLIMSNLTWTLWFSVHHGLLREQAAAADFDYDAEAADKFAQAVRDLDDPGFGRLIDDVRGPRPGFSTPRTTQGGLSDQAKPAGRGRQAPG